MEQKKCGCPVINDEDWHCKYVSLAGKTFYTTDVSYIFSVPLNVESRTDEAAREISRKGYLMEEPPMMLEKPGLFSGQVLIAIVPPDTNDPKVITFPDVELFSYVYRSKKPDISKGIKKLKEEVKKLGRKIKAIYTWPTTCPECAKSEGYVTVLFAELEKEDRSNQPL